MLKQLEAQAPHDWQIVRRYGRTACRHRISELSRIHGDLSAGVCSLLLDGYDQRADARYIRAMAAAELTKDDEPEVKDVHGRPKRSKPRPGMIELLRLSIQLSAGARQAERDAWELASREAEARRVNEEAARSPADLTAMLAAGEPTDPAAGEPVVQQGDQAGSVDNSGPCPPFDPPGGLVIEGPHPPLDHPRTHQK